MTTSKKADSTYFIFDFDYTIVSENSDTFIPFVMKAENSLKLIKEWRGKTGWTELMDQVIYTCQKEDGKTIDDVKEAATQVPMNSSEMKEVLLLAAANGPVHIVSDANDLYINSFLSFHKLKVNGVHTNPTTFDKEFLRLSPFAQQPHGCSRCPTNMCKSVILKDYILPEASKNTRPRIFYFGDGSNDFCPLLEVLEENDVCFVRNDSNDLRARGLIKKINEHQSSPIRARVITWEVGRDLLPKLRNLI